MHTAALQHTPSVKQSGGRIADKWFKMNRRWKMRKQSEGRAGGRDDRNRGVNSFQSPNVGMLVGNAFYHYHSFSSSSPSRYLSFYFHMAKFHMFYSTQLKLECGATSPHLSNWRGNFAISQSPNGTQWLFCNYFDLLMVLSLCGWSCGIEIRSC